MWLFHIATSVLLSTSLWLLLCGQPHFGCCCVQALIVGVKLVLYNSAALVFAACIHAVAKSPFFWRMCQKICSQAGPLPTEMQAFLFTLAFSGFCALLEEVWH